ncbi:putative disease resistance RPP13-like protein 1 [Acorus calamus]|uniref:Disease resistance RPP13-like protein 1 n=1 Tax=Acorus calamus TaxID=4465 RepID=A0AAV9F1P4_ACOCL|nr:putative disease resistance RPP13-like protein 1 [Acorus calamus]
MVFVGGTYSTILNNLMLLLTKKFPSGSGIKEELRELQAVMGNMKPHLNQDNPPDEEAQRWLRDLYDVAYDADDLLDEFLTLPTEWKWYSKSSLNEIESRIKQVRKNIEKLLSAPPKMSVNAIDPIGIETSSFIEVSEIVGRDKEKDIVLNWLLSNEVSDKKFSIMTISGAAGIGKTALAQLVFNDERVKGHFKQNRMWWVHHVHDAIAVMKEIISLVEDQECTITSLERLQRRLESHMGGKKYLLVLDGLWEWRHNVWDNLHVTLNAGGKGSKVLVTNRSEEVIHSINGQVFSLEALPQGARWTMFSSLALGEKKVKACPELIPIGEKIVDKCNGLPLALKVLGEALQCETRVEKWNMILENDLWELEEGKKIFEILRLSYQHLRAPLKWCFSYCAVFPKGFVFEKDKLVRMWIAQGFVQPSAGGRKQLEDIGEEYFDQLFKKSFFQLSHSDHKTGKQKYLMPDLISDLARSVSVEECLIIERPHHTHLRCPRHLSCIVQDLQTRNDRATTENDDLINEVSEKSLYLRTFLLIDIKRNKLPEKIWNLKVLRILDLSHTGLSCLDKSIGTLIHLRYLNLSNTPIQWLPESIGNLHNLQTLELRHCIALGQLPKTTKNLINLRHLDMRLDEISSNVPWSMPPGMGALTSLQTLSIFLVGDEDSGCGVSELKSLAKLRGQLCIKNLQNVESKEDAKMALEKKQHLRRLELQWNRQLYVCGTIAEGVIGKLKPHTNLQELLIRGYPGSRFPDWMEDSSFSKLTTMKLYDCHGGHFGIDCPDLVKLHSLKHLHLERMSLLDIRSLPMLHEFSIRDCDVLGNLGHLPLSLKIMEITYCRSLNSCETEELPNLRELTIINCPRLEGLPGGHLPSLTKLEIKSCKSVKFPSDLTSLTNLVIEDCENEVMKMLHTLTALRHLDIKMEGCNLAKNPLPLGITHLTIGSCLGICPTEWLINHKSLESLKILKCRSITSLDWGLEKLTSLEYMEISECNQLTSLPPMGFPVSLQFLSIHNCKLLKKRILFQDKDDWRMTANILWVWIDGEPFSVEDMVRPPPHQGQSSINLNDVGTVQEANILNLQSTDSLRTLKLTWKINFVDTVQQAHAVDVLESLQPHTNLQSLNINGYKGSMFPSWIEDISFSNLTHVTLEKCQSCERLPPFGQLPALRKLYINGMRKIGKVDREFFGSGSGPVFPSLQKLSFCELTHWKEWNGFEKEDREIFPRLLSLSIVQCLQLTKTPTLPLSLLEFHISECDQVSALGLLGPNETPNASLEGARPVARIERLTTTHCRRLEYNKEMELQLLSSLTEWTFSFSDVLSH